MHWLYTLWYGYVYPSLKGNGPEAAVEIGLGFAIGRYAWPRIKRHLDFIKAQNAHIIKHHPDIPPFEGETHAP